MRPAAAQRVRLSIEVNDDRRSGRRAPSLARRYVLDAMHVHPQAELSILLVDDGRDEQLHVQWMDEPGPTDVLSFPMDELRPGRDEDARRRPACSATSCSAPRSPRSRRARPVTRTRTSC